MEFNNVAVPHSSYLNYSKNFLLHENETEVYIEHPYPISKPLPYSEIDIIAKFQEDITSYNTKLCSIKKDFPLMKNYLMNQNYTESHATISKGILTLCNAEKHNCPFIGDFNHFYTGFLEQIYFNGESYLVRPDIHNNLRFSKMKKPWKNRKLRLTSNENITKISKNKIENMLLLKYKHKIDLLQFEDLNDSEIVWSKKFKSEVLDANCCGTKIILTFLNGKCVIYDIESNKKIDLSQFNIEAAYRADFIDERTVAVMCLDNFNIIDLRSKEQRMYKPDLAKCDYLCCFEIKDDMVYLASRHNLLVTDVRLDKEASFCSHLMNFSPAFIQVVDKTLCLSSQNVKEKVIFYGIHTLPRKVPSILDTLKECRLNKDVLLKSYIDQYLMSSVGGIKLLNEKNELFLYWTNSVGDLFKQKIGDPPDEQDAVENLFYWINNYPEPQKSLHLTDVVNLSETTFLLTKPLDNVKVKRFTSNPPKLELFLKHTNKKYNKNTLGELATNFASIWQDEDDEEEVDLVPEVNPLDKVNNWIESNYFLNK